MLLIYIKVIALYPTRLENGLAHSVNNRASFWTLNPSPAFPYEFCSIPHSDLVLVES